MISLVALFILIVPALSLTVAEGGVGQITTEGGPCRPRDSSVHRGVH